MAYMIERCHEAEGEWLYGAVEATCVRADGEWLYFNSQVRGFVPGEESETHSYVGEPMVAAAATEKIDCGEALPEFANYPVSEVLDIRTSTPDFSTQPAADHHRTAISKDVAKGINFAGHYVLAEWGCGENCYGMAVVDAKTGAIQGYGVQATSLFDYRADSRLIGSNTENGLVFYVLNESGELVTICNQ